MSRGITGPPCFWRYKYGCLAFHIGGISNETVEYGHEFCGIRTLDLLLWQGPEAIVQVNYRPVFSSESVLNINKPAIIRIIRQKTKSGRISLQIRRVG
jgi:hypothetical protein